MIHAARSGAPGLLAALFHSIPLVAPRQASVLTGFSLAWDLRTSWARAVVALAVVASRDRQELLDTSGPVNKLPRLTLAIHPSVPQKCTDASPS